MVHPNWLKECFARGKMVPEKDFRPEIKNDVSAQEEYKGRVIKIA